MTPALLVAALVAFAPVDASRASAPLYAEPVFGASTRTVRDYDNGEGLADRRKRRKLERQRRKAGRA